MTRQKAYLLPDDLCPVERIDVCISVPNNLGHILPFLAQLEWLANWYAWENNDARDNNVVAECWRDIFNSVRENIDNQLGCGVSTNIKDIRLVDCVLEKQDPVTDEWSTVGSIADCVVAGINNALSDGTIPPSPYPVFPEPTTNSVNTTERDVACGIADFTSDYLIEKWNDQLDLIESLASGGATVAKIAADVVSAITGIGVIAGGAVDAIKDLVDGSIALTFAVIHANDTVEWRSMMKCIFYSHLKDNGASFGTDKTVVVDPIISDISADSNVNSPLFAKFLQAFDIRAFQRLAKISEDNEGECDDCDVWCYAVDLTGDLPSWLTIEYGTHSVTGIKSVSGLLPRTDVGGTAYGALLGIIVTMPADGNIVDMNYTVNWQNTPSADTRHWHTFYHGVDSQNGVSAGNGVKEHNTTPTSDFSLGEVVKWRFGAGWSGSSFDPGYQEATYLLMRGNGVNPFGEDNCV